MNWYWVVVGALASYAVGGTAFVAFHYMRFRRTLRQIILRSFVQGLSNPEEASK